MQSSPRPISGATPSRPTRCGPSGSRRAPARCRLARWCAAVKRIGDIDIAAVGRGVGETGPATTWPPATAAEGLARAPSFGATTPHSLSLLPRRRQQTVACSLTVGRRPPLVAAAAAARRAAVPRALCLHRNAHARVVAAARGARPLSRARLGPARGTPCGGGSGRSGGRQRTGGGGRGQRAVLISPLSATSYCCATTVLIMGKEGPRFTSFELQSCCLKGKGKRRRRGSGPPLAQEGCLG